GCGRAVVAGAGCRRGGKARRNGEGAPASAAGLAVPAGHGLACNSVAAVARIPEVVELNSGHFLVGEAIFSGLGPAIRRMRSLMDEARFPAQVPNAAPATP